jgi:formiminotetrahydrofolate cyclodeaminase
VDSLERVLQAIGDPASGVAGGAVAAGTLAMAAALVTKVCRGSSPDWDEAPGVAAQSETIRARAAALVEREALAFGHARAALSGSVGNSALHDALAEAAAAPLAISAAAADLGLLAALAARRAHPDLRADAVVAATLAAAAADAGANLVAINLVVGPTDSRLAAAQEAATDAAKARHAAVAAVHTR